VEPNKAKVAIIGLVVLGIAWQYFSSPPSEIMTLIIVAVSGLGGFELRGQVRKMKIMIGRGLVEWKEYYWRAIGYFLAFGGFGFIADELIGGYLDFTTFGHEWIGVILFLIGLGLISVKPKGK